MKKLTSLTIAAALFATPALHAAPATSDDATGKTATRATSWTVGLIGVGAFTVVATLAALGTSKGQSSFNH